MVIMKWNFTSKDEFDLNSSLFIIKAAIGCLPEVGDDIEDIPEFDWDSCPTIGCMCRTNGALFGLQPQRQLKQYPQIFLGESRPPSYDEFSVCWQVKLEVCVSVLVISLENIDYMDWAHD
ncbi:CCQ_1a_G0006400.mRNA.1.CDS.1 [Saccharomyces cerevisiae]|nr:CCQ_1a_G0006400.mRNA.1.CDS.1 [Saccharomyces cerevisiae]CAI7173253.1 CCQ_1a_G0006400.mRNA.1.CDS.1 [Saccharomyces cerevisiae]